MVVILKQQLTAGEIGAAKVGAMAKAGTSEVADPGEGGVAEVGELVVAASRDSHVGEEGAFEQGEHAEARVPDAEAVLKTSVLKYGDSIASEGVHLRRSREASSAEVGV